MPGLVSHIEGWALKHTQLLSLSRCQQATCEYKVFCLGQSEDARSALGPTRTRDYTKFRLRETDLRDRMASSGETTVRIFDFTLDAAWARAHTCNTQVARKSEL